MRKFFKSRAEQVMRPANVELLMGHEIGISTSYYKPTEHEILQDYLKAVDLLTINGDTAILQKQVQQLKENAKDNEYTVKGKLQEKDEEIRLMKQEFESMRSEMNDVLEVLKIAKLRGGRIGKDKTMYDEKGRVTFG